MSNRKRRRGQTRRKRAFRSQGKAMSTTPETAKAKNGESPAITGYAIGDDRLRQRELLDLDPRRFVHPVEITLSALPDQRNAQHLVTCDHLADRGLEPGDIQRPVDHPGRGLHIVCLRERFRQDVAELVRCHRKLAGRGLWLAHESQLQLLLKTGGARTRVHGTIRHPGEMRPCPGRCRSRR